MGIEIFAAAAAMSAAASVGTGIANYVESENAANAQRNLVNQQKQQLADEQAARNAEAAREATTGSMFGFSDFVKSGFSTPALKSDASPNTGRGQITGMG